MTEENKRFQFCYYDYADHSMTNSLSTELLKLLLFDGSIIKLTKFNVSKKYFSKSVDEIFFIVQ